MKQVVFFIIGMGLFCGTGICSNDLSVSGSGHLTVPPGDPLPAWETDWEKAQRERLGFPQPESVDTPPAGGVESYAEWAASSGVIVSWMGFQDFLTEMVREFVQVGTSWVVVESASQQSTVSNHLLNSGISLDNVEFLVFNMDSVWMVDYGPFFVQVDGEREIVDHIYDRFGRWNDDAFPSNLGSAWGLPVYESDLRIEGGNFIADGAGICFITDRVIEQNQAYLTEQEVYDRLESYCGCETVHVLDRLEDGTGHIDMFAKLLDADTMLMGQYDPGDPEYTVLENNAAAVAALVASTGEPYEVVRIPMPGSPSAYWTYSNSIIVNEHVFVPTYNDPLDAVAMAVYQAAMPDHTIVSIDASDVIGSGGAVHCTTKVVPTNIEYQVALGSVAIDDTLGDGDGLIDPGESIGLIPVLRNVGFLPLTGIAGSLSCLETQYVTVTTVDALWPDIPSGASAPCQLPGFWIAVDGETPEQTVLHFTIEITADNYTSTETFSATVSSMTMIMGWNLDTDPGWTAEPQWAWGVPAGSGGDPSSGHTGTAVYGYNLSGTYGNNLAEKYLTSLPLDFSDITGSQIRFMRWLGVEDSVYDHAAFRISTDGSAWTTIWEHSGGTVNDGYWVSCQYDVSSIADGQSTVYLRWVMGSSDGSIAYCGWNVDDIEIWGVASVVNPTATPEPCIHNGDVNMTGEITAADAQLAFMIALGSYSPSYAENCAADCNGDGTVTAGDAQGIFQTALGIGTCVDPL
ncbi:agmatine deiminase family protein [bacterium]|nr:agmatine deiminase family protein [candidate division CSSED10-310 bacterium]